MTELSDKILELRKQGISYRAIQKELNCSRGTIAYHCNNSTKDKIYERTKQQRFKINQVVSQYKEDAGCADCHGKYPYFVLQFDHKDPAQKTFNISRWRDHTGDIDKIMQEIEKCDVVCANCHAFRTYHYLTSQGWKDRLEGDLTS